MKLSLILMLFLCFAFGGVCQKAYATIAGKNGGGISKAALISAGKLVLVDGTAGCYVDGFMMAITYKWKPNCDTLASPQPMRSDDNKLTSQMLKALKTDLGYSGCYSIYVKLYNIVWGSPDRHMNRIDDMSFILNK